MLPLSVPFFYVYSYVLPGTTFFEKLCVTLHDKEDIREPTQKTKIRTRRTCLFVCVPTLSTRDTEAKFASRIIKGGSIGQWRVVMDTFSCGLKSVLQDF